jgi:hypothetical protein
MSIKDKNASKGKSTAYSLIDSKKGKGSEVRGGIIGQAGVPPSGTQYRSDRIPPAYAKQGSTKSK